MAIVKKLQRPRFARLRYLFALCAFERVHFLCHCVHCQQTMIRTYCCSLLNSNPVHRSIGYSAHAAQPPKARDAGNVFINTLYIRILTQQHVSYLSICFVLIPCSLGQIWKIPLLLILFWNEVQEVNGSVLAQTQNPICSKEQYTVRTTADWCFAHFERKSLNNIIQGLWGGAYKRTQSSTKCIQRLWAGVSCHATIGWIAYGTYRILY